MTNIVDLSGKPLAASQDEITTYPTYNFKFNDGREDKQSQGYLAITSTFIGTFKENQEPQLVVPFGLIDTVEIV